MKSLKEISATISEYLNNSGNNKFSPEDISTIIELRNNMLYDYELVWIDWYSIDELNDEKEKEFREAVYDYIFQSCISLSINIEKEDIELVFRIENDLLEDVFDIGAYYDLIENFNEEEIFTEFSLNKWTEWNENIDKAVYDFATEFGIYPNILIANEHTFSQINFLINNIPEEKSNVYIYDEKSQKQIPAKEMEDIDVDKYVSDEYSLSFFVDNKIEDKKLILKYVEGRDDDDDDDDDDDNDDGDNVIKPVPVDVIKAT